MEFKDKVTIVTGGAGGAEGAKVVVADLDGERAAAVAAEIGGLGVGGDVRREADVKTLVAAAEKAYGPVDVFFSNAGIANGTDPLATSLDVWQQQWELHVLSHVHAIRAVLPSMLERGSGYLIQTASMAGILTSLGNAPYAATKHGAVGLAEWMSITYHTRGIRTSLLAPLGVRTNMLDVVSPFARLSAGPIKEPEEVARMVVEAVREERFLILTDPIAQTWNEQKTHDLERWLGGMRRLQSRLEKES